MFYTFKDINSSKMNSSNPQNFNVTETIDFNRKTIQMIIEKKQYINYYWISASKLYKVEGLLVTNTDKKTNNTKIYINIKTFSSIPVEKRIGIYKKLYTKYHELDDLLLISLNNLLQNILIDKHMKLYSKDQYKNINPLKNYKLII